MLISYDAPHILGSYQENEYSPAFQSMMSRVVARIYRHKKNNHKIAITNVVGPSLQQDVNKTQRERSPVPFTYRKNSANATKFFSLPRSVSNQWSKIEKDNEIHLKGEQKLRATMLEQSNARCKTQPRTVNLSLCRKLMEYNQCLVTRTCKFQEKERMITEIGTMSTTSRKLKNSERVPIFKKFQQFKHNKKQANSKIRVLPCQTYPIAENDQQIDCRPWQSNQRQEARMFFDS